MKKFITIITVLISSFFFSSQVNALEYYEKIEFKTAFEESVKTEEIKSIGVAMAVDPTPQGEQYYNFDVELLIEENYYYVFSPQSKEKVLLGELFYNGILVDVDAGGTKYETEVNITYPTAKTAVVQVLIYPKDVTTTKSTADQTVMEEVIKDHFMTEEERRKYEEFKKQQDKKTSTTKSPDKTVVVTDPATGKPVIDPETGEQVTTVIKGTTTTTIKTQSSHEIEVSKKQEQDELEKQERDEKETFILIVMYSIIGIIVVVGGVFVGVKFYKASKMQ